MVGPETVHTDTVTGAKLTGSPEDAVALIVNGGELRSLPDSGGNVIA